MKKITDKERLDYLASDAWRLSYDEMGRGKFKWRVHSLETVSKPYANIRRSIDAAIRSSRRKSPPVSRGKR